MSAAAQLSVNGSGFGAAARPKLVDRWAHLQSNESYMNASNADNDWKVDEVLDKIMDEAGDVIWVVKWKAGMTTKNNDSDMTDCNEAMADFEATHGPSSTNVETVLPGICEQSPYAACTTISELIVEVTEREKDSSVFKPYPSFEALRCVLFKSFASMDPRLLYEILRGNVQRRRYLDRDFRRITDEMRNEQVTDEKGKRPAIYEFDFTDQYGKLLSDAEARQLLDHALRYLTDQQFAFDTDLEFDPLVALDHHRYLNQDYNKVTQGSPSRKAIALEFIRLSVAYLDNWGAAAMLQAWREVGYAHDANQRFTQHICWKSSNYLMVLIESISFKYFDEKWSNRGELIFNCFNRNQAAVMEVALTAISGAKMSSGHGMSHHPTGLSIASNYAARDVAIWEDWEARALPMVKMNVAAELTQLDKEKVAREVEREKVATLEATNRRARVATLVQLRRLEVEMARLHLAVRRVYPPGQLQFDEDAEIADSQSDE